MICSQSSGSAAWWVCRSTHSHSCDEFYQGRKNAPLQLDMEAFSWWKIGLAAV